MNKLSNLLINIQRNVQKITIVIPAYNESYKIINTIKTIQEYFQSNKIQYEIIIIDDGSTDDTVKRILFHFTNHKKIRLIQLSKNYGKGFAVKTGVLNSRGDIILITDADLSVPIHEFKKLLHYYNRGYQIVIGSRALKESNILVPQTYLRKILGRAFNLLVRLTTKLPFKDTQCGFKLLDKNIAQKLFNDLFTNGFAFDVEILLKAFHQGYKIKEVPITWKNYPDSKVKIIKDSIKMILELFMIIIKSKNK